MPAVTGRNEGEVMLSQEPVSNNDDVLLNLKIAHTSNQVGAAIPDQCTAMWTRYFHNQNRGF